MCLKYKKGWMWFVYTFVYTTFVCTTFVCTTFVYTFVYATFVYTTFANFGQEQIRTAGRGIEE